jgi:periplasmic divalent cation tolerance protein
MFLGRAWYLLRKALSMSSLSRRVLLVLVTTSNRREAVKIGEAVVAQKLAACANLVPSVTSIYRWKGRMQKSHESLLIMKTTTRRYPALAKVIRAMHSYEVPEIIGLTVERGSRPYLEWVLEETATD